MCPSLGDRKSIKKDWSLYLQRDKKALEQKKKTLK